MRADLKQLTDLIKIPITSFAEIGSRDGHDSHYVSQYHKLNPSKVYIFEAHPGCFNYINKTYPHYNSFNVAITKKNGVLKFNAGVIGEEKNVGISSLLVRTPEYNDFISKEVEVDGWKMESILEHLNIEGFDLLKIDVEGAGLDVLMGFGDKLQNTKFLQIELEYVSVWEGQSLYEETKKYLNSVGFEIIEEINLDDVQCDVLFKNTTK
jgi:FkbM family methyltransferase